MEIVPYFIDDHYFIKFEYIYMCVCLTLFGRINFQKLSLAIKF